MIRILLIVGMSVLTLARVLASDVDSLLNVTGVEFSKEFEVLAKDAGAVQRLRASPVVGESSNQLRHELMRRLVLARVDAPDVFASFADMLSLIRPDSPLLPDAQWWVRVAAREAPDILLLRETMGKWMAAPPANNEEWVKVFREIAPQVSAPDQRRMENRFWPPIAYGLSAEPMRRRVLMKYPFRLWAANEGEGELQLEALLWFCERTDFDSEAIEAYAVSLNNGFEQSGDKAHLVTRCLAMMEIGDKFMAGRRGAVPEYLNLSEKFGDPSHGPVLRRLAASPLWSVFQEVMLDIAQRLEAHSTDKSHVVTRELAEMEGAKDFDTNMIGYRAPGYLADAVLYGTPAHAVVLRKLADRHIWALYRDRMIEVATQLERANRKVRTTP